MRKIVKGKGKCDRQAVDAEFVIELDGEESKLFKEMFAEWLEIGWKKCGKCLKWGQKKRPHMIER